MRHQAILIALLFLAAACGSSEDSPSDDADGSGGTPGTGGRASSNGSGSGGSVGSVGSGTGGSIAASGSGGTNAGSGGRNAGTGGRFGMDDGDGGPMMAMCPATVPADGSMCQGGGRRGMACEYADQSCRCRRGSWSCDDGMQSGDDGGMN